MAYYIPLRENLPGHPKLERAAELAGVSEVQMLGHLVRLWLWAMEHARTGDLSDYEVGLICRKGAGWNGAPATFITALVECRVKRNGSGFLEAGPKGALRFHDWEEHAKAVIDREQRKRDQARERMHKMRKGASPVVVGPTALTLVPEPLQATPEPVAPPPAARPVAVAGRAPAVTRNNLPVTRNGYAVTPIREEKRTEEGTVSTRRVAPASAPAEPKARTAPKIAPEPWQGLLFEAFEAAGLEPPVLAGAEGKNAALLFKQGATADDLAEFFKDVRDGHYPPGADQFAKTHLSFQYAAGMQRVVNWRTWKEQGKPKAPARTSAPPVRRGTGPKGPEDAGSRAALANY